MNTAQESVNPRERRAFLDNQYAKLSKLPDEEIQQNEEAIRELIAQMFHLSQNGSKKDKNSGLENKSRKLSKLIPTKAIWGEDISFYVKRLLEESKKNYGRTIYGNFNGASFDISPNSNIRGEELQNIYDEHLKKESEKFLSSDEYSKQQESQKKEEEKQNMLLDELENLDFSDIESVLDWIVELEQSKNSFTDDERYKISTYFLENGFERSANTGNEFNKEDKENVARYIIGQALSSISNGTSIHQIVSYNTKEWKNKFGNIEELLQNLNFTDTRNILDFLKILNNRRRELTPEIKEIIKEFFTQNGFNADKNIDPNQSVSGSDEINELMIIGGLKILLK